MFSLFLLVPQDRAGAHTLADTFPFTLSPVHQGLPSSLTHPSAPHRKPCSNGPRAASAGLRVSLVEGPPAHPGHCGHEGAMRMQPSLKAYANPNGSMDLEADSGKPQQGSYLSLFIRFCINYQAMIAVGIGGQEAASCLRTFLRRGCQAVGASSQV